MGRGNLTGDDLPCNICCKCVSYYCCNSFSTGVYFFLAAFVKPPNKSQKMVNLITTLAFRWLLRRLPKPPSSEHLDNYFPLPHVAGKCVASTESDNLLFVIKN